MSFKKKRNAQQWSLEVILAISVFIVVFIISLSLVRISPPEARKTLELDSVRLYEEARAQNGFIEDGSFNYAKFNNWFNETKDADGYLALKNELGVSSDFCIFIEDGDGNIIVHETEESERYYGIGGGNLVVRTSATETESCGQQLS